MTTDKQRCLFLDRDGVINKHPTNHYVMTWDEFEFLPGVIPALQALRPFFHRIVVVTNQQGVGKGLMEQAELEHIHDQNKFMGFVKKFLNPTGKIFFGFPPWYNPFGGHQQICESKILSKFPYFHLLPKFLYKGILKIFGESEAKIDALLEIRETGISIERFERILNNENYKIDKRTFYLINPNYEVKFNLKPKEQFKTISSLPFVRNFLTTAGYYLVSVK